ncbi:hypothetical protein [Bartonella sp. B1099]|uniref:hypothetical protein n=1 Tax=Bartonella sp. B1099 TaxID=2911422 RepID=UPI0020C348B8|nr:hypothetical protein [Bartonella sp. B1099]
MREKARRIGIVWSCLFHVFEEAIWDSARGQEAELSFVNFCFRSGAGREVLSCGGKLIGLFIGSLVYRFL